MNIVKPHWRLISIDTVQQGGGGRVLSEYFPE